jgi:DNA-binding MarR family transcriptional regulator
MMSNSLEESGKLETISGLDPLVHAPARLMVMTYLYVVDRIDYVYLHRVTGLSWGNLSKHLSKLEDAGYLETEKTFQDKKPNTSIKLTDKGRKAYQEYKDSIQEVLGGLPDN